MHRKKVHLNIVWDHTVEEINTYNIMVVALRHWNVVITVFVDIVGSWWVLIRSFHGIYDEERRETNQSRLTIIEKMKLVFDAYPIRFQVL